MTCRQGFGRVIMALVQKEFSAELIMDLGHKSETVELF